MSNNNDMNNNQGSPMKLPNITIANMTKKPDIYLRAVDTASNPNLTRINKDGVEVLSAEPIPYYRVLKARTKNPTSTRDTSKLFPFPKDKNGKLWSVLGTKQEQALKKLEENGQLTPEIINETLDLSDWNEEFVFHTPSRIAGGQDAVRYFVDETYKNLGNQMEVYPYNQDYQDGYVYTRESVATNNTVRQRFINELFQTIRISNQVKQMRKQNTQVTENQKRREKETKEALYSFITYSKHGNTKFAQFNTSILERLVEDSKNKRPKDPSTKKKSSGTRKRKEQTEQSKAISTAKKGLTILLNILDNDRPYLGKLERKDDAVSLKGARSSVQTNGNYLVKDKYVFDNEQNMNNMLQLIYKYISDLDEFLDPNDENNSEHREKLERLKYHYSVMNSNVQPSNEQILTAASQKRSQNRNALPYVRPSSGAGRVSATRSGVGVGVRPPSNQRSSSRLSTGLPMRATRASQPRTLGVALRPTASQPRALAPRTSQSRTQVEAPRPTASQSRALAPRTSQSRTVVAPLTRTSQRRTLSPVGRSPQRTVVAPPGGVSPLRISEVTPTRSSQSRTEVEPPRNATPLGVASPTRSSQAGTLSPVGRSQEESGNVNQFGSQSTVGSEATLLPPTTSVANQRVTSPRSFNSTRSVGTNQRSPTRAQAPTRATQSNLPTGSTRPGGI